MKNTNQISPLTIKIDKETWDKFKTCVPRSMGLNDAVVKLISDFVNVAYDPEIPEILKSKRGKLKHFNG